MGKTVTTYLIDGDPKGTQYAFISNKICQMFVVPRSNLAYLNTQEKLQKPAFYILLGEDEATKPQAYIGETEKNLSAIFINLTNCKHYDIIFLVFDYKL